MTTKRFLSLAIIFAVLISTNSAYAQVVTGLALKSGKWLLSKYAENKEIKGKMQEIQPAYDAWLETLEAYVSKTGKVGDCDAIGFKYFSNNRSETPNFSYECGTKEDGNIAFLKVKNKVKIGKCDEKSEFRAEFDLKKNYLDVFSWPINDACIFFQPSCRTLIPGSCPAGMVFVGAGASVESFCIGKYEVTQKEWRKVLGINTSKFQNCGDNCPEEQVYWGGALSYITNLNRQNTGMKYRLPTDAEWEYAARGGCQSMHYQWSGSNNLEEVAWYRDNSKSTTHPVGTKKPNELGIYDMSGNVWEWVSDKGDVNNGIVRGGAYNEYMPLSYKQKVPLNINIGKDNVGLRLVHPPIEKNTQPATTNQKPQVAENPSANRFNSNCTDPAKGNGKPLYCGYASPLGCYKVQNMYPDVATGFTCAENSSAKGCEPCPDKISACERDGTLYIDVNPEKLNVQPWGAGVNCVNEGGKKIGGR
ncbi:MAG: formylglycine-generating enzyme family protein [Fibromonadaceae bacterium]|jgi:hypothetical protein|nr:formylglycine-generating enzyme family protein [Fibromonadaceae bacterium]